VHSLYIYVVVKQRRFQRSLSLSQQPAATLGSKSTVVGMDPLSLRSVLLKSPQGRVRFDLVYKALAIATGITFTWSTSNAAIFVFYYND
jgi:hypothetical protein